MPLEHLSPDDGAVDVPLRIDADAFRPGVLVASRLHVLDERRDAAVASAADANSLFDARDLARPGVRSRL